MAEKRNTIQKETVRRIALSSCDHPTAESIFASARQTLPNISLGTVYRVLHELVEEGEILEVPLDGKPSRFDKTNRAHAHLVCKSCGDVYDVKLDVEGVMDGADAGENVIEGVNVTFDGLCARCKHKFDASA